MGESNEIDDRSAGMALTKAEKFEPTAAATGHEGAQTMNAEAELIAAVPAQRPDRTKATVSSPSSSAVGDEETSQSQYYYEYAGPTTTTNGGSGEARRASSRGRSLVPTEPNTALQQQQRTDATDPSRVQQQVRKAGNSEMEDILDGFVKLLNGQPGQAGYRQPPKTRINNRGPPRISDATVVLEPPAFVPMPQHQHLHQQQPQQPQQTHSNKPPKDPPPYPFDVPQPVRPLPPQPPSLIKPFLNGVPLPEQLVPTIGDGEDDGDDEDDVGPPSLYDNHHHHSSRRPPPVHPTAKPQQEYDLFATPAHNGHHAPDRFSVTDNVTEEKFSPKPPQSTEKTAAEKSTTTTTTTEKPTTTTEKPTSTTEKPTTAETPSSQAAVADINATRVIGLQVSKIVDHLTSPTPFVPSFEVRENATSVSSSTTTTANAVAAMESMTSTPLRPETTSTGEQITGVGSAVVVLEPSTSEEPHRDDAHKPTDNKLLGKPTAPIKKTPQQSGNDNVASLSYYN